MYEHKPNKINTAQDLIDFLEPIPPSKWCVDKRNDGHGRHCVLGHIDAAYRCVTIELPLNIGSSSYKLVCVNNGTMEHFFDQRPEGTRTDGFAIRKRVLNYLRSLL